MPDAAREIVYTGAAKPPSWGERLIRAHTPETHYQELMKKYFWVTDRLEGKPKELVQRIRPQVELAARAAGWTKTGLELFLVGQAAILAAFLGYRTLQSAGGVFRGMARRHGSTIPELPPVALIESPPSSSIVIHAVPPDASPALVGLEKRPSRVPASRMEGFLMVSERVLGGDSGRSDKKRVPGSWVASGMRDALREYDRGKVRATERAARREGMKEVGRQAMLLGKSLHNSIPDISHEARRHAQRAYGHMLQRLLSDNGIVRGDLKKVFQESLGATKPRSGGLKPDRIDDVVCALRAFIASGVQ